MRLKIIEILILASVIGLNSCEKVPLKKVYLTKNVIIVILDGARNSETWGDSNLSNIPNMKRISESGVLFPNFFNIGITNTIPGYVSILTGNNQEIDDTGLEIPEFPSIFQYWNKEHMESLPVSRIFTSKYKLSVLSDCIDSSYNGKFMPIIDCGTVGTSPGDGYRADSVTLRITLNSLAENHPRLLLLGFSEPDYSAHNKTWMEYVEAIKSTDRYVYQLWNFIENDKFYKGTTAIFITSDHGRHLDNVKDGFISHGDTCDGCRHISLLAFGPDFKKGVVINTKRELTDLPATIAEVLKIDMPSGHGSIMSELLK